MRIIGLVAAFAASLALVVGCGGDDSSSSGSNGNGGLPEEIVVGAAIAKTGYLAPFDANIAAVKRLLAETNAEGGVDGHKVTLVEVDNRSDPQQAAVAAQQVIEKGGDVLLFSCESLTAAAQATVAQENGKLNFTMCANEPGFGPPTTGRLSFSANPSLLSEASARASFLYDQGIKRPFLFRDTSLIYGKADCSGFEQTWEELGGEIAGSADFQNSDESVASQINDLKNSDADAVVMCSYPPGGAAAIKQIRAAGIDVPIAAPSAFDGTYWLKGISNTDDIFITLNGSAYDPPDERTAKLFASLEKDGVNTDVSSNLLAAYAAGQLMLQVIGETGSVDGDTLADALEAKPHETIIGEIEYTPEDHFPTRTWPIYVIENGKPKLVTEVKPQFIPEYGG